MAKHVLLVMSNATEGGDAEFNDWYTNTHLGDVLKVKGFKAAQRFKLSDTQLGAAEQPYKYMARYEVETEDLAESGAALTGAENMYISPTLDRNATSAWFYTPISERVSN
jgi:hypothetical protein